MPSLVLCILAEVVAAALLTAGYLTRFAALVLSINMAVAFFIAHGAKLSGPGNGELALIYLAAYLTILFAGSGRFAFEGNKG
jgi:putative oxidoreductase